MTKVCEHLRLVDRGELECATCGAIVEGVDLTHGKQVEVSFEEEEQECVEERQPVVAEPYSTEGCDNDAADE